MKKDYILFIDSGIGGLSTLAQAIKSLDYNYIYFADNKNAPYGSHKKSEILSYLISIIKQMCKKYHIKVIVIACNTATAAALDDLRAIFSDIFIIGTEPAINLAIKNGYKRILSLTTPLTKSLDRYKTLENKADFISTLTISNLARLIDDFFESPNYILKIELLKIVAGISNYAIKYDCIVLGCTHYLFLRPMLNNFSQKPLIDGNDGISKRLLSVLSGSKNCSHSSIKFFFSKPEKALQKKYIKILSQTLAK